MFSRLGLFFLTNILVVATVSAAMQFFGVSHYLHETAGLRSSVLLVVCFIWGFSGSIISLLFSKIIAKRIYQIEVIERDTEIPELKALVKEVERISAKAGLKRAPDVGIYDSDEVNAFATGPTRNSAIVALSTGLLASMNSNQIKAVLGHEIGHIANGDMVTLTLIQGTVNSFVLFFSRICASLVYNNFREGTARVLYSLSSFVLDLVFTMFGSIIVSWFSRRREFRADESSAELVSPEYMVDTLRFLQSCESGTSRNPAPLAALKIESGQKKSFLNLFSSHPKIEKRIDHLRRKYSVL